MPWRIVVVAAAMLLVGCTPSSQTPPPTQSAPTKAASPDPERLAYLAEECGATWTEPSADNSFTADVSAASEGEGMRLSVEVDVSLDSSHGRHEAHLRWLQGYVGDADDTVVGMVTTNSADETTSNSATVEITLGACPGGGLDLGDPLADGTYALRLYGIIDPTDHVHAQAENWVAEPLTVTVADGTARLG